MKKMGNEHINGWLSLRVAAVCFFVISVFSLSVAQEAKPAAIARQPVPIAKPLMVSDTAQLVTEFDVNGLKVLIKRREGSQTVVAGLFIKGGARNITAESAGIEDLMLDAASEASTNFPRERLRTELARMGTTISSGVNYDYSALSLASTRPNFDRSWEIFADVALRPAFNPQDVERVRNRMVLSLRDDADTPDSYLQQLQARVAYAGHPYANDPRGTAESVSRLTAEDVRRFHKQVMETSRLLLVLVGDLDPQLVRQRIATSFGKLPRGDYRSTPLPELSFAASTVEVTERDLPTNYVQGVFSAPSLAAADVYPMRVASSILQNRLFVEIRAKRNLSYAPEAFLWSQGSNLGGVSVSATDANQSVRIILDEIGRLQNQQISQDELKGTIQHYLTRYYLGQETNAAQASELAQAELLGGGWRNSTVFMDKISAVTPADVQRVAQKYMRNIRFVVLGNPKSIDTKIFTGQTGG
ncbi:MAG TPA: pitrilysin family protein [Pyrinomonadaceae bacterium]|jgi:zinc protease|nr:pitrilysin family protein [Pyrinomonadaceae bacterium]